MMPRWRGVVSLRSLWWSWGSVSVLFERLEVDVVTFSFCRLREDPQQWS